MNANGRSRLDDTVADLAVVAATLVPSPFGRDVTVEQVERAVDGAAHAGFRKVATSLAMHDAFLRAGRTTEQFRQHHEKRALDIFSVSVCTQWRLARVDDMARAVTPLLDVAAGLRASAVTAICPDAAHLDVEHAARGMAFVCDLAADRGLSVNLEFMPGTAVPDLPTALQIGAATARENFGIVLDPWQWARNPRGLDWESLEAMPADLLAVVQLNDVAPPLGSAAEIPGDADRALPGEGAVDLARFVRATLTRGGCPVVAAEVIAPARLAQVGPRQHAVDQFTCTVRLLGATLN